MNWLAPIALLIALYGAALSTINMLVERRKRQPRLRIILEEDDRPDRPAGYSFGVINVGDRPVALCLPFLRLPNMDMRSIGFDSDEFEGYVVPHPELLPHRSRTFWIDDDVIIEKLAEIGVSGDVVVIPVITDETGNAYKGDSFTLKAIPAAVSDKDSPHGERA